MPIAYRKANPAEAAKMLASGMSPRRRALNRPTVYVPIIIGCPRHLSSAKGRANDVAIPNMLTAVKTAPRSVSRPKTSSTYGPGHALRNVPPSESVKHIGAR